MERTVFLQPGRMGGAETYVRQLIENLATLPAELLQPFQFRIFISEDSELEHWPVLQNHPNIKLIPTPVDPHKKYRRIWWEQRNFPTLLRGYQLDLMHFPYGTMSLGYSGQSLVTVHDTLRFCFPNRCQVARSGIVPCVIRR
ncbi:MAG: hypothetical protein R3C11_22765 [Planctomycetaceae bacterium]